MAIDATRFSEMIHHLHILWSGSYHFSRKLHYLCYLKGPLQLIITLFLLYRQMQFAIIPGVALLLIMIPTNLFLQRIQKRLTVCICL